jgi:F-type H+-transporting ATPase subunit alpha
VVIWAGTKGYFDDVAIEDVKRFEAELLDHMRRHTSVLTTIAETGKLEPDTEEALRAGVEDFRKGFVTSEGKTLGGEEVAEPGVEVEVEQIVRQRKR